MEPSGKPRSRAMLHTRRPRPCLPNNASTPFERASTLSIRSFSSSPMPRPENTADRSSEREAADDELEDAVDLRVPAPALDGQLGAAHDEAVTEGHVVPQADERTHLAVPDDGANVLDVGV